MRTHLFSLKSPLPHLETLPDWCLFTLVHTFSFGLIFFNRGLFWDDWVLTGNTPQTLTTIFKMMGPSWPSYFYNFIIASPFPLFLIRSIAFFSPLLAALCLNNVLKTIREVDSLSRIYLVLFFLLMPVYSARIGFACALYNLCNLLFFTGLWLTKKYFEKRHLVWRICALAVLFVAMTTNSIVMFYVIVLLYIVYRADKHHTLLGKISSLKKYPDYIALPVLFASIKYAFLVPYGSYENYNQINLFALANEPLNFIAAFYFSFVAPIDHSVQLLITIPLLIITATYSLFKLITSRSLSFEGQRRCCLRGVMVGIIFILLALFPYLAVLKMPNLGDWDSRHQLLVPLGAAFIIFYGFNYLFQKWSVPDKLKNFFLCLLLALFMFSNINLCLNYQRDWYKQLSLLHHFSDSSIIRDNNSFLINDKITNLNVNGRDFRHYEYTALIRLASHDRGTKFAFNGQNFAEVILNKPQTDPLNWHLFTPEKPQYRIVLNPGTERLSKAHTLSLIVRERVRPKIFEESINNITSVNYEKY